MNILIVGAGAVGGYFGIKLSISGAQVTFAVRESYLKGLAGPDKLGRRRFTLRETGKKAANRHIYATDAPESRSPYGLIIFAVKFYDLDRAAQQTAGCLKEGGAVLSLVNGVESEERLTDYFDRASILYGAARVGSELERPGVVRVHTGGGIDFGDMNGEVKPRTKAIARIFRRAGILERISPDMFSLKWEKVLWNAAFNTIAAVTGKNVGEILDDPDGKSLARDLMKEALSVGMAEGAKLSPATVDRLIDVRSQALRPLKTSTRQDLEKGKPLEYDAFTGAIIRKAAKWRLPVPKTKAIHHLIRMFDSKS